MWYVGGDNKNGESKLAGKSFFDTDENFKVAEFMHFCSKMLIKEPKETNKAPCMIVFCAFEQQFSLIELAKRYCEYALIFYRDKLPKFNNNGKMVMNCMDFLRDDENIPKLHPTQKPVKLLEMLIRLFTDEGDVVIDPCCGSGSTLRASENLGRKSYGFEIKKEFVNLAKEKMFCNIQKSLF